MEIVYFLTTNMDTWLFWKNFIVHARLLPRGSGVRTSVRVLETIGSEGKVRARESCIFIRPNGPRGQFFEKLACIENSFPRL